jgi:hypothetical protein
MFPEEDGNTFVKVVVDKRPQITVEFDNEGAKKPVEPEEIILDEFVEVMGVKAKGKKLSNHPVKQITWLDPIPVEEEEEIELEAEEDIELEEDIGDGNLEGNEIDSDDTKEVLPDDESDVEPGETDTPEAEKIKEPKKTKEPKEPKAPKEPKEPKEPKAVKEIKEHKPPLPPINPPDFPEDDDLGTGIQMSLF